MDKTLCLKPGNWPDTDRAAWQAATTPAGFLETEKPASDWSASRIRICEQAYGQWLAWLARQDALETTTSPDQRVTEERIRAFVQALQARVAPYSVSMMVGAVKRTLEVIAPTADWSWLKPYCAALKRSAEPSRNRFLHAVLPDQLLDLGIRLMETAGDTGKPRRAQALLYRDGLMIAMLTCCPIRLKNFAALEISTHLTYAGDRYRIDGEGDTTKTGSPIEYELPDWLSLYVDVYLNDHRRTLQSIAGSDQAPSMRLWIDRWGKPASHRAFRDQIKLHTRKAFGRPLWPHLFRHCAATGLVHYAPDDISLAADLLGHETLQTTQKHYILARGEKAHREHHSWLSDQRQLARERMRKSPNR